MKNSHEKFREIIGYPIDPETGEKVEVEVELDHFYTCKSCKQWVDMRNLGEVFHHEEIGHKPLPTT